MSESANIFFLSNCLNYQLYLPSILIIFPFLVENYRVWLSYHLSPPPSWATVPDCSALGECVGTEIVSVPCERFCSSRSHSCSFSIRNPILEDKGSPPTSAPLYLLFIPFGSAASLSPVLNLRSIRPYLWNLYFYARGFLHSANIYAQCGGGGNMIASVPSRPEPRLHQKTGNCFVRSPRQIAPSLSQQHVEGRKERTIW